MKVRLHVRLGSDFVRLVPVPNGERVGLFTSVKNVGLSVALSNSLLARVDTNLDPPSISAREAACDLRMLIGVYLERPAISMCIIQLQSIVPIRSGSMPVEAPTEPRAAKRPVMKSWKTTIPHTSRTKVAGQASPLAEAGVRKTGWEESLSATS